MTDLHEKNVSFLIAFLHSHAIEGIELNDETDITYFASGAGTHLYLLKASTGKYLVRINHYKLKNSWGAKIHEYKVLKKIEKLGIAPKVYYVSTNNKLDQDFTIVDYIEGTPLQEVTNRHAISLAGILKKLHSSVRFKKTGCDIPPTDKPPYKCNIFNEFANGEDKKIELYKDLQGIEDVIQLYNRIREVLGDYFNSLTCFDGVTEFVLVHGDLKKENILDQNGDAVLIDWEYASSDVAETDIGRLFAGIDLSKKQQDLFLDRYYSKTPDSIMLERIYSVKKVLDFFGIIDDYILQGRKKWSAKNMRDDLLDYEEKNF